MKFIKVDESTLRCLITEEEMEHMGYGLDDLISNKEKAQDFLQIILADAEDELGFKMNGVNSFSVEATVLPGNGVSLTITGRDQIESIREKIKRFHDAMVDYTQMVKNQTEELTDEIEEAPGKIQNDFLTLRFISFDKLAEYCSLIEVPESESCVYKDSRSDEYHLFIEKEFDNSDMMRISGPALEFSDGISKDKMIKSFMEEHGKCIIKNNAIETLAAVEKNS